MKQVAKPGIASLLAAQFVSALADNALLLLAMALLAEQGYPVFWIPLLKLMFTLSYVVLGPWVGAWADRWPKRRVMMWANGIKAWACLSMLAGVPPMLAYAVAGLGAAIYAPAKYGLITELTPAEQLVRANGWIEVSTVCAALFGVMLGGLLVAERLHGWSVYADLNLWLGSGSRFNASLAAVLLLYGVAAWLNRMIPDSGVRYASHEWHVGAIWQRFKQDHLKLWRDPLGSISLSVTTLFWGVGATLQLLVLAWAQAVLHLSLEQAAYLQGATALGVIAGAALAARTVALQQAPKVLVVGLLLGALLPWMAWVQSTEAALVLTFVLGLVGGFFVVPMNALLQHRGAQLLTAGRSISVQNVNENANILVMMGIYSALLHAGISVVDVCWLLGAAVFLGMAAVQWRYWKYVQPLQSSVKAA